MTTVWYTNGIHSIEENSIDKNRREKKKNTFNPPTLDEVKKYINEKGLNVDAEKFYNYFSEGDWIDSKGNHVKNWKQKILTWNGFAKNINQKENVSDRQYKSEELNKYYLN